MSPEHFDKRLERKLNWYNNKSIKSKRRYYTLKIIEIICALLIVSIATLEWDKLEYVIMFLSIAIASAASLQELFKDQKNWILYRDTYEKLCAEKSKYSAKVEPYNNENAQNLFVIIIENILKNEHSNWSSLRVEKPSNND